MIFYKYTETERIIGKTCLAIYVIAYIYGAIFDDSMIVFIMLFCCMGAVVFIFTLQNQDGNFDGEEYGSGCIHFYTANDFSSI